ncbi:MAG: acyltransferase 3 [Herbaspirillum sp.]|nr:acyltransferase 3 [Herbaspirillum sp.]
MNNKTSGRIEDIEVLRAVAIIFTLFSHAGHNSAYAAVGNYASFWSGVDLFLVISGFIISRDLIANMSSAPSTERCWAVIFAFWIRRFFRIFPSALLWLAIPIILSVTFNRLGEFGVPSTNIADSTSAILSVANIHAWSCFNQKVVCSNVYSPYWSLSLEEQFYWALPIVFIFSRKKLPYVLGAFVLAQFFIPRQPGELMWYLRTDALMLGVLLTIFTQHPLYRYLDPQFLSRRKIAVPFIALLIWCLVAAIAGKGIAPFSTGIVAIIAAVLVLIASYDRNYLIRSASIRKVFVWIGSRSYALYLIHMPARIFTHELWNRLDPGADPASSPVYTTLRFFLVAIPLMLVLAEMNYRFIEVPLRRKGHILSENMKSRIAAPLTQKQGPRLRGL